MGYQDITSIEDPQLLSECVDYTDLAILSVLETVKLYNELEFEQMIAESHWIQDCLEAGLILPVTEADDEDKTTFKARSTGTLRDIANAIKLWIDEIISKIRQSAVKRSSKYVPWVEDVENQLIEAAGSLSGGVSMTPYYNGKWSSDPATTVSAINKALSSLHAKKVDDFSFASPIVDPAVVADSSKEMSTYVKNYYRFGVNNVDKIETENLVGAKLAEKVPTFIAYLRGYADNIPANVKQIANAYKPNKVGKIASEQNSGDNTKTDKTDATEESLSPYTYLSIEDRMIFESVLSSMINYEAMKESYIQSVMEVDNKPQKKDDTGNPTASVKPVDNGGKETTANNITNDESQKQKSEPTDGNKEEKKNADSASEEKEADDPSTTDYLARIEYFVKLAITGYATACDERFCKYIDVLKIIAKAKNVPLPKFTDSGEYIPIANRTAEKTGKVDKSSDGSVSPDDQKLLDNMPANANEKFKSVLNSYKSGKYDKDKSLKLIDKIVKRRQLSQDTAQAMKNKLESIKVETSTEESFIQTDTIGAGRRLRQFK